MEWTVTRAWELKGSTWISEKLTEICSRRCWVDQEGNFIAQES